MPRILGAETTDDIGKLLAGEHMADDPSISKVFLVPHHDEVRLIEVSDSVPANGEIFPFRFTKDLPDIPFESLVVLIHPDDWARQNTLRWPEELDPSKNDLDLIADRGANGNAE